MTNEELLALIRADNRRPSTHTGEGAKNSAYAKRQFRAIDDFLASIGDSLPQLNSARYMDEEGNLRGGTDLIQQTEGLANWLAPNVLLGSGIGSTITPGTARMFIGPSAKTANLDALARAEALEKAGASGADVARETGWMRAPWDGKWRAEINDSTSSPLNFRHAQGLSQKQQEKYYQLSDKVDLTKSEKSTLRKYNSIIDDVSKGRKLSDIAAHDDLFEAYPQVSSISVVKPFGEYPFYSKGEIGVSDTLYPPSRHSHALHETQHAIQDIEGFAKGGSSGPDYRRLSGEAEARLTQARANMTPEQRAAQYPYDPDYFKQATGVSLDDLITRYGDGPAMAVPDWAMAPGYEREAVDYAFKDADELMAARNKATDYAKLPVGAPEFRSAALDDLMASLESIRARNASKGLDEDMATGAIRDEIARRNAVEQLGLPEGNTAADRAKAMGYKEPAFHGTASDILAFGSNRGKSTGSVTAQSADWATNKPVVADEYADYAADLPVRDLLARQEKAERRNKWDEVDRLAQQIDTLGLTIEKGQNILPLYLRGVDFSKAIDAGGLNSEDFFELEGGLAKALNNAKGRVVTFQNLEDGGMTPATHFAIRDPSLIRSRFAAFDPKLRDSANLLAGIAGAGLGLDQLFQLLGRDQ